MATRKLLFSLVVLVLFSLLAPLFAWKSVVHVYLAQIARADAIDDGQVTIYEVDYETGQFVTDSAGNRKIIGSYPVDPFVLTAIRTYPRQFKAGAVGPDAYPDIITGQTGIHPDNSERVEDFLYRQLVIGPLVPAASAGDIADHPTYFFNYAPPRVFINLKNAVNAMHGGIAGEIAACSRERNNKLDEAKDCAVSDPTRSTRLAAEAAALKAEKTSLETVDAYFKECLRDIEAGRKAWGLAWNYLLRPEVHFDMVLNNNLTDNPSKKNNDG